MTRFRLMAWNIRRSTYKPDLLFPTRRWSNRKKYAIRFAREVGPSVIATQECTGTQVVDLTNGLGANWTFWGEPSNRQVLWDSAKWVALDAHRLEWRSKGNQTATFVRLKRLETGDPIWVVSCHLTVGDSNQVYRAQEMLKILEHLHGLPGYEKSVICGDLNDSNQTGGVRKLAAEAGWKRLQVKAAKIEGRDFSTFNGWKRTPTTGRWIDEILTPPQVRVNSEGTWDAAVELDCLRIYPICASDHNGLRATIEY